MSTELIGILTVGVALAALNLGTLRGLRTDIGAVRGELHGVREGLRSELHGVRNELRDELHGVRDELRADVRELRDELHNARDGLRGDIHAVDERVRGLDNRMRTQERSTAKLEGLLEGLREAVVVRAGPRAGAGEPARHHGREQVQG